MKGLNFLYLFFFWGVGTCLEIFTKGLLVSNSLLKLLFLFVHLFETRLSSLGESLGRVWEGWSRDIAI